MSILGIDIGGSSIKFAVFNAGIPVHPVLRIPLSPESPKNAFQELLTAVQSTAQQISAVGIGVPGVVDPQTFGRETAVNIPGLHGIDLISFFQAELEAPVALANDGNLTALAEGIAGAGKLYNPVATISLGTGAACGIVMDGAMYSGFAGRAAEFGHIVINRDGRKCNCGLRGCLERYCSASGLVESVKQYAMDIESELGKRIRSGQTITAETVAHYYATGDKLAQKAYKTAQEALGYGLAVFQTLYSVEAVVFSGGMMRTPEPLLEGLQEIINENLFSKAPPLLLQGKLGDEAGCYGAALHAEISFNTK